jgi:glutamate-1-semialdehyde 2,1-aminomutase
MDGFMQRVGGEQLACVLIEPVLLAGGNIPADKEFLQGLREYCNRTGALLVYDEVVTGFRLGLSGAQGRFGVNPDVTVLGKIIGGGLPIGAVCGREEIMERMDHTKYSGPDYAYHGGTFSANALSLAAGLAAINVLEHTSVYEHIDRLGDMARNGLNRVFENAKFPSQATGVGSLFAIHFTSKKPLKDISGYASYDHAGSKKMFRHMLEHGVLILLPDLMHGGISHAHTESDIRHLITTTEEFVKTRS